MSVLARLAAAVALVGLGFVLSPDAVPIYDGIGTDEPYRYVQRPAGAPVTADATTARAASPVVGGTSQFGLNVSTAEVGPQFSLFVPPQALAVTGPASKVEVVSTPQATVDDAPAGTHPDANAYLVTITAKDSAVALTAKAALATLQMRSTTAVEPPPAIYYRPTLNSPWTPLDTSRSGNDIYAARFPGEGQFQLVYAVRPQGESGSPWPFVALGGVTLLAVTMMTFRLRSAR